MPASFMSLKCKLPLSLKQNDLAFSNALSVTDNDAAFWFKRKMSLPDNRALRIRAAHFHVCGNLQTPSHTAAQLPVFPPPFKHFMFDLLSIMSKGLAGWILTSFEAQVGVDWQ